MVEIDFNNLVPPVEVYGHTGNPFKSINEYIQKGIETQNNMNIKHGGMGMMNKTRRHRRLRIHHGGEPIPNNSVVIPQAPVMGGMKSGPNTGNHLSQIASQLLANSVEQAKYDNQVQEPTVQTGGSLKTKLERMLGNKPTKKGNKPTKKGSKPTKKGNKPTKKGSKPTKKGNKPTKKGNKPTKKGNKPTKKGNKPTKKGSKPTKGKTHKKK